MGADASQAWDAALSEPQLVVDVDGFEGPLDLLLHLARRQKVDLARISILALAEQFIRFVEDAKALRLELAADYLVMAAWLAYLKSGLLVPRQPPDAEPEDDAGEALRQRLLRLQAMRDAAQRLVGGRQLNRDVFARGAPQAIAAAPRAAFSASLHDLLSAYAARRQRAAVSLVTIAERDVWSLVKARERLETMAKDLSDWTGLERIVRDLGASGEARVSATASAFAAALELVRENKLEVAQAEAFGPLFLRAGSAGRRERP